MRDRLDARDCDIADDGGGRREFQSSTAETTTP
jgi:hypothetical protein